MKLIAKRILVTVVGVPLIGLLWLLADGTRPYLRSNTPVEVDIPRGVRTTAIARQLEEAGAIHSRWTFLALHWLRRGNTLKAGEYSFEKPTSPLAVLGKLIRGDVSYQVLVVPEGSNRFEIAGLVAAEGFSTRKEFLDATEDPRLVADLDPDAKNLEGYLFPDSYHLPRHARPAEIVRGMLNRFREVYALLHPPTSQHTLHEVVTIASLVEKETWVPEERPLIAGIFYNRLNRRILLQADPTVSYAAYLVNGYTGRIRKSELDLESPYNTYRQYGLPPGPITNPGKAALRAAFQPTPSDFLYFVANVEGGHVFSRTLAEHNIAVAQYRESQTAKLQQSLAPAVAQ